MMNKLKKFHFILRYYITNVPFYFLLFFLNIIFNSLLYVLNSVYLLRMLVYAFEINDDLKKILIKVLFVVCINIIMLLFNMWFSNIYSPSKELVIKQKIQKDVFNKAIAINLKYYDNNEYYDEYIVALNESGDIGQKVLRSLGSIISNFVAILGVVAILQKVDFIFILIVFVSLIVNFALDIIMAKKQTEKEIETQKLNRKVEYYKRVFYLKDHIEEIKSIQDNYFLFDEFSKANAILRKVNRKKSKKLVTLYRAKGIIDSILTSFCVYFILMYKLMLRTISIADFTASLNSIWRLSDQLSQVVSNISAFVKTEIYCEKIYNFMNLESDGKIMSGKRTLPTSAKTLSAVNLNFSYDGKSEILKNININIKPYETIAIVGRNGSGKTTLVKLLMGLYHSQGSLLLDGIPFEEYDFQNMYSYFQCLFQDHQIYATTLKNNIYMDNIQGINTANKLHNILKQVGLERKIQQLDKGLDTVILPEFDDSAIELSGGEKQKLALGRILVSDACIIVLDEPSSSLDPLSESDFNNLLMSAFSDRTVIFISHRLFSTKNSDRIYLMANGEIKEQGTHNELMQLDGEYANMYKLQKEKYSLKE